MYQRDACSNSYVEVECLEFGCVCREFVFGLKNEALYKCKCAYFSFTYLSKSIQDNIFSDFQMLMMFSCQTVFWMPRKAVTTQRWLPSFKETNGEKGHRFSFFF